jgi:hypothetical protein
MRRAAQRGLKLTWKAFRKFASHQNLRFFPTLTFHITPASHCAFLSSLSYQWHAHFFCGLCAFYWCMCHILNKSWSIVGQGMFQLNQMEQEMCQYLDWELKSTLSLQRYGSSRWPTWQWCLQSCRIQVRALYPLSCHVSPCQNQFPLVDTTGLHYSPHHPQHTITLVDTPSLLHLPLPPTSAGMIDNGVKIVLHGWLPGMPISAHTTIEYATMKQKMFAFATPSVW